MALPESNHMVTVQRLSAVVSGVWEKAKVLFATKVANPTTGNFAGLDSNGNLTDSGKNSADFATSAQGGKADSAIQGVKVDGSLLTPDADKTVNVQLPQASASTPLMDGTATAGTETAWAKGDHVHPTDTSRQAVLNMDSSIPAAPSEGHYPSSKAVADFVNSSISTNTANFLGSFTLTDLGLTYPATDAQIATALDGHAWPTGVTPTNNDYVYVEIQDPQTTGIDDKVERFKYSGTNWMYEYTLNNSSFTAAEVAALESGVTAAKVGNYDGHIASTNNPHSVTKSQVGLGSVVNTGDSATPVSGGTTKFTTGGAYTELAKKVDKETGKGLSANDFTNTYKTKLDSIASGAEVNVQSNWNQSDNTKDDYIKNKPNLATVATSGSYNDLSNKPTIPAAQVSSDWNATSGVARILNKPSLATVATSGSYNDLSNKPTIPAAANNGILTITQNGTSKGTFSANQSGNGTIALTDTTYSAGTGISLSGTTFSNSGVRSVSWDGTNSCLSVDVGGTTSSVGINYANNSNKAQYATTARTLSNSGGTSITTGYDAVPIKFFDGLPATCANKYAYTQIYNGGGYRIFTIPLPTAFGVSGGFTLWFYPGNQDTFRWRIYTQMTGGTQYNTNYWNATITGMLRVRGHVGARGVDQPIDEITEIATTVPVPEGTAKWVDLYAYTLDAQVKQILMGEMLLNVSQGGTGSSGASSPFMLRIRFTMVSEIGSTASTANAIVEAYSYL